MTGYYINMSKISHPGLLVKRLCLEQFNLSVIEMSKLLKVPRPNLSLLLNGKMDISPIMAIRLEQVFNTDAREWLELQLEYDLAKARRRRLNLKRVSKKFIKIK